MPAAAATSDGPGTHDLEAVEVDQRREEHEHRQQRHGAAHHPVQDHGTLPAGTTRGASEHLERQHELVLARVIPAEPPRVTEGQHHRQSVHDLQLQIQLQADIVGVLATLPRIRVGDECRVNMAGRIQLP